MMPFDWMDALKSFVCTYQQWPVMARAVVVFTIAFLIAWPLIWSLGHLALRILAYGLRALSCVLVLLCRGLANALILGAKTGQGFYNHAMDGLEWCHNAMKRVIAHLRASRRFKKIGVAMFVICTAIVGASYLFSMNAQSDSAQFASTGVRLFESLERLIFSHLPLA